MLIKITGRHMEITEALRSYAEKKVSRVVNKYNRVSEIEVLFESEAMTQTVEIILKADNHQPFVVRHSEEDAYASLDAAIDKIERQLVRHKEKTRNRRGRTGAAEASVEVIEAQDTGEESEPGGGVSDGKAGG